MIEVLVTMVVVGVGLMGLIALMLKGMQASSDSAMRSIASAQAYDMADRMRANVTGLLAHDYDAIVPPGSITACPIAPADFVAPPDPVDLDACSTTAGSISSKDKCIWHKANAVLPLGAGAVCKHPTNNWYTIHISWDDRREGLPTTKFILRFEP